MLTGDTRPVADSVGRELGVDEVFAEVARGQGSKVAELQAHGRSPWSVTASTTRRAAQADVGIAIGAGTDVAIESAGSCSPRPIPWAVVGVIHSVRASYRKMVQNLAWATGYNLDRRAARRRRPRRRRVSSLAPAVGAILMSVSTIVVALNAY